MSFDHLMRQWDLIPLSKTTQKIHIIGAGGIGSHTSIALAKMGFTNQVVWDFDKVSIENMNNQGYRFKDIGKPKVECLRDIVFDYSNEKIQVVNDKYTGQKLDGIVISAVDSMEVRKLIWDSNKNNIMVDWLIDPRMSIEYALMYVMCPTSEKDITSYEKTLYTDDQSVQEPCTMKAVIYTANMISGLIAKAVKNLVLKQNYPRSTHWNIGTDKFQSWEGAHG